MEEKEFLLILGSHATIQLLFWVKLFTLSLSSSSLNVLQTSVPWRLHPFRFLSSSLFLRDYLWTLRAFHPYLLCCLLLLPGFPWYVVFQYVTIAPLVFLAKLFDLIQNPFQDEFLKTIWDFSNSACFFLPKSHFSSGETKVFLIC